MNGNLLNELRCLAEASEVDEQAFRRIMLAAMHDQIEHNLKMEAHTHPDIDEAIEGLKRRDLAALVIGALAGLGAIAAAFR